MSTDCDQFRSQIPRALMADLEPAEQEKLDRHLCECAPCARERDLYLQTLGRMRSLEDVPVPRHFLVSAETRRTSPWKLYCNLSPVWQGAMAASVLILVVLASAALTRLEVRADGGALIFAFGNSAPAVVMPPPVPALDTAALEAKILRVVEERNRREEVEWVRKLRADLAQSRQGFTRGQRELLDAALVSLETRMNARVEESARTLDERRTQSLSALYQAIRLQQDSGLALVDAKLNRLALSGEKKNSEIDAILETILQVAELNSIQSPGEKQ